MHSKSEEKISTTPRASQDDDEDTGRGRQQASHRPEITIITPPRSRSAERKRHNASVQQDSQNRSLVSNNHQVAYLMPSADEKFRGAFDYTLRHHLTSSYRRKKDCEEQTLIHRVLISDAETITLVSKNKCSNSSSGSGKLSFEAKARAADGPTITNLDGASDIAHNLLTSPSEVLLEHDYLYELDDATIKECIIEMRDPVIRDEMREITRCAYYDENSYLSASEYKRWVWLDRACNNRRVRAENWRCLVNDFLVWILVCKAAWKCDYTDDFLRRLGVTEFVLEWNDIEYEIKLDLVDESRN